jgi:hypothetical protein
MIIEGGINAVLSMHLSCRIALAGAEGGDRSRSDEDSLPRNWRPSALFRIAELGEDNLFHLGEDGLETITMVIVEIRRGRSLEQRRELGRRIVDICTEVLNVPRRTVLVEFTIHAGDEILRDGQWAGDWTDAEATARPRIATAATDMR